MKCPSFERLIDYLESRLEQTEAGGVATHLETGCVKCESSRRWYLQLATVVASDESIEPPGWVFKRAVRIFEAQRSRPSLVERMGEAIAKLVFDSLAQPGIAGVRSAEVAGRQLLYRAGAYNVDIEISQSGESRIRVKGQLLREGEIDFASVSSLPVSLVSDAEVVATAATSRMGEFAIEDLRPGDFDLRIETRDGTITIAGLPASSQH